MKRSLVLVAVSLAFCVSPLFAASPNMQEGKWEISMSVQPKGVPFALPAVTVNQCITKKDLEDNKSTLPSGSGKKNDCEAKDVTVAGNTTTWKTVCKDGTRGDGTITYKGTTYDGTLNTTDKNGGQTTTKIKAKRVGDCK